jgi:hypothetical protein
MLDGRQTPVQMGHHGDRDAVQQWFDRSRRQTEMGWVDVGVRDLASGATGGSGRVPTRIGGREHGAWASFSDCTDGQLERIGSAGHANAVIHADEARELSLKCLVLRAVNVPTTLSDSHQHRFQLLAVIFEAAQQVIHRDRHSITFLANRVAAQWL